MIDFHIQHKVLVNHCTDLDKNKVIAQQSKCLVKQEIKKIPEYLDGPGLVSFTLKMEELQPTSVEKKN